jgi:putative endonuclease
MKALSKIIGDTAEQNACAYLQQRRLKLIIKNYQCKCGEIDLIMQDDEVLVFVEVRHRTSSDYGDGVATVNKNKQHRIIKAATYYLQKNDLYDKIMCRFDVVATSNLGDSNIQWIKDAFWAKW